MPTSWSCFENKLREPASVPGSHVFSEWQLLLKLPVVDVVDHSIAGSLGTLKSSALCLWSTLVLTSQRHSQPSSSLLPTTMPASLSTGFWQARRAPKEPQLRFQKSPSKVL